CHRRRMWCIGKNSECLQVRYKANFTNRPHPLDRGELVKHVHGLHRYGQTDAIIDATAQSVDVGRFTARYATVIGVKESYQAYSRLACHLSHTVSRGSSAGGSFGWHRHSFLMSFIARAHKNSKYSFRSHSFTVVLNSA